MQNELWLNRIYCDQKIYKFMVHADTTAHEKEVISLYDVLWNVKY